MALLCSKKVMASGHSQVWLSCRVLCTCLHMLAPGCRRRPTKSAVPQLAVYHVWGKSDNQDAVCALFLNAVKHCV